MLQKPSEECVCIKRKYGLGRMLLKQSKPKTKNRPPRFSRWSLLGLGWVCGVDAEVWFKERRYGSKRGARLEGFSTHEDTEILEKVVVCLIGPEVGGGAKDRKAIRVSNAGMAHEIAVA